MNLFGGTDAAPAKARTPRLTGATPLYAQVPKDLNDNIAYRRKLLAYVSASKENAETVFSLCACDMLWWVNTFVFTYDPRKNPSILPFITYGFQDDALLELQYAIAKGEDRGIEKSRDMGASWMTLLIFAHAFLYNPFQVNFRLISRKEALVDNPGDPDSLFSKLDFIFKHLPGGLKPPLERTRLHYGNLATSSSIDGESTTSDSGRGGRSTADGYDEFASVENGEEIEASSADRTNCRIFTSTPKGQGNAFYKLKSRIPFIRMHWSRHPEKAAGLYTSKDGVLQVLNGDQLADYPYILDGRLRSPWYDRECQRRPRMVIAQELDIDYLGSDYQFFDVAGCEHWEKQFIRPPFRVGELQFDRQSLQKARWNDVTNGRFRLWRHLDQDGRLGPEFRGRQWVITADVAMGTGASNSTLAFGVKGLPEKIGEAACPRSTPQDWADLCIALAYWLSGESGMPALIKHEANGPGRLFTDRLLKQAYPRVYWRTKDGRPDGKQTEMAGWWSTPETKLSLLGDMNLGVAQKMFVNRSDRSLSEARLYVFRQGGVVEHSSASLESDPSGAKANHGDMVIADALLWSEIRTDIDPLPSDDLTQKSNTFWAREQARKEKARGHKERVW